MVWLLCQSKDDLCFLTYAAPLHKFRLIHKAKNGTNAHCKNAP